MQLFISFSILILIFFISKFIFKNLKSKFYEKHQKLAGKESIPLIGGIVIFIYYSYTVSINDLNFLVISFLILLLGFFSDNNSIQSPKLRLILQTLILTTFIYISDLQIDDLRNDFLNNFLTNYYFGLFFTTFCLLVLINGSNFIDGLDGLNLGYFFIVTFIVFYIARTNNIEIDENKIKVIFYLISFLLIMNIKNFLYLGDSGSYLIGFIFGVFLIELNNYNYFLSPYYIALLLWYPAFENLFSIIRKLKTKFSPLSPDNKHLHQLLYASLKKKVIKNKLLANNASSLLILSFNFVIIFLGTTNLYSSIYQIKLIICSTLIYLLSFVILRKNLKNY